MGSRSYECEASRATSRLWLLLGFELAFAACGATPKSGDPVRAARGPIKVLLDTDIGPDCDDAGTVALLWGLAKQGESEPLGFAATVSSPWAAPTISAINTYYHHPELPVGTLKQGSFLLDSLYSQTIANSFPNALQHGDRAPDAVTMYRQILLAQADHSVTMVAVGPLRNMRNLLESRPDELSSIAGRQLIADKVVRLVVMGGTFPVGGEWNIQQDIEAARIVAADWPSTIVYSGGEVGGAVLTGAALKNTPAANPVRRAYELAHSILDPQGNRPSWDQTAMLFAVRGESGLFRVSEPGTVEVQDAGITRFVPTPGGRHHYLKKAATDQEIADVINRLMTIAP